MTETRIGNKVINIRRDEGGETSQFFPKAQGHEKILASCKKNRVCMSFALMDGSEVQGHITQFDRWTITIRMDDGNLRTLYKHALRHFEATK